jgi:hypothetical protein
VSVKDELLNSAAREYKGFHEAVQGLNEEQMSEVWLGTWSIREIVAHIVGWQGEMTPALERMTRGERPIPEGVSYDDVDAWNAKFASTAGTVSAADLLLALDRSHEAFMHAAAAVPDDRFQSGKSAYRIVDLNSAHHYKAHGDEIRAWRSSRGV